MRKISPGVGVFVLSILISVGTISFAQDGLKIRLEPIWMGAYGYDEHVGDVFFYKEEWNSNTLIYTYGIKYDPINLNMKDKLTLKVELNYIKNQWGLSFGGWHFDSDGLKSGRVITSPMESTDTGYIYYENGVRMWDQTIWPLRNDLEDSGFSPVDWYAKNKLGIWTVDLFGIRTLTEKTGSKIDFIFGLKLGSLNNEREEGQYQRSYVYYENLPENFFTDYPDWPTGYDWDNYNSLKSTSKADYEIMLGPLLGFGGKARHKRWGIEGFITQSVLFGDVKFKTFWEDIDNIWYAEEGEPIGQYEYDCGYFPFTKREETALPVTELKLKLLYSLTDNIFLGAGTFLSIWWNTPVAPKFSIPGSWVAGEGTGWRLQKRTLTFKGFIIDLGVHF